MNVSVKNKRRFIEIYSNNIKKILELKWWLGESDFYIVRVQLYVKNLEMICDHEIFFNALKNVLGRPVLEQELCNQDLLIDEFESKYPQYGFKEGLSE